MLDLTLFNFFPLWLLHALGWFVLTAILLLIRGQGPSMKLMSAMAFGLFSAVFHLLLCHFIKKGGCPW